MKFMIAENGTVRGLWNDAIDWLAPGPVVVHRASHVESDARRQQWYVQLARPRHVRRRVAQWLLRRPCGEILHLAATRAAAIAWECENLAPGMPLWQPALQTVSVDGTCWCRDFS